MVKALKLSAKDLRYPLQQLLENLAVIHNNRAYTGYVFFAESDLKELRHNYRRLVRKEFPKAKKYAIDAKVNEYFYSLSTNMSLEKVVKPGFVLVDYDGIGNSIRKLEENEREEQARKYAAERLMLEDAAARAEHAKYNHALLPRCVVKFFVDNFGEPTRS